MSAPLAGKFQDHYEVLEIDPRSDSETIQRAYLALSSKFDPRNGLTGNKAKFDAVNTAFEVLSDPDLRQQFNKLKGISDEHGGPKFSGLPFFDALGKDVGLRTALLCILYDRRRTKPFTPSLSMRHVENMLNAKNEQLVLAVWYLKQKGLAENDDKSSLQISVEGMDFLEHNPPSPDVVMAFLKPGAIAGAEPPKVEFRQAEVPPPPPAPPAIPKDKDPSLPIAKALASDESAPGTDPSLLKLRRVLRRV